MNEPREALPLSAVLQLADEHRRRRDRIRAVAAPAAGVLAAGLASAIVVAIQIGGAAEPAPPLVAASPPSPRTWGDAGMPAAAAPAPFEPGILGPLYVEELALLSVDPEWVGRPVADAEALAAAWDVPRVPEAQAIVAKAALVGKTLAVDDLDAGDELAERFLQAGYTLEDAEALAEAWEIDPRSAAMLGALLAEAG